jgi:hypothetical protein
LASPPYPDLGYTSGKNANIPFLQALFCCLISPASSTLVVSENGYYPKPKEIDFTIGMAHRFTADDQLGRFELHFSNKFHRDGVFAPYGPKNPNINDL